GLVAPLRLPEDQRCPNVGCLAHDLAKKLRRRHTNDSKRKAIQGHLFAKNRRRSTKAAPPETIADDGDRQAFILIPEGTAEGGSDAQHGKVIPGNDPALSGFDLAPKSNIDLGDVRGRDKTGEGAAMIAQIQIISGCKVTELTRLK